MSYMLYGNTPCFLNTENISKSKDMSNVDAIVYGIPWEGAVTWGIIQDVSLVRKLCGFARQDTADNCLN